MGAIDRSLHCGADNDETENDNDCDDDGGNVGEWVVLTVPLSRQLQFLMQAGRCQVLMLLFDDDGDDDDDDDNDDHDDHDDEKGS